MSLIMSPRRLLAGAACGLLLAWTPTACCSVAPKPQPAVSSDGIEI
jgi:hypothetical protein